MYNNNSYNKNHSNNRNNYNDKQVEEIKSAEEIVKKLISYNGRGSRLSVSQIRKLLSGVNVISNKIKIFEMESDEDKMPNDIKAEINYLRIRFIYQMGREPVVKEFGQLAGIDRKMKEAESSIEKYKEFNRFVEEVVAYHKYHGGK